MGFAVSPWAALLLLVVVLMVQGSLAAPPAPTATKRSDENIQFGNQQNKPVSVLDEDAQPGAFPSSETIENGEPDKPKAEDLEGREEEEEEGGRGRRGDESSSKSENEDDNERRGNPPSVEDPEARHHLTPVSQHLAQVHHRQQQQQTPRRREEMTRDLPPVALASRWRPPSEFYNPHWSMPISPLYGAVEDGTFPARRRRRSAEHPSPTPDPKKLIQVSLQALRTGHRHKREVHDIRRIRRDLSKIDLDKLRRGMDVVELLAMLARLPKHQNSRFATVTYAPLASAPPRFAPQPKLFPDYEDEEEEEEDEEEEDEDDVGGRLGLMQQPGLQHSIRPPVVSGGGVMLPPDDRIWRRSGGYSLSAMPGFKRSAFRANTPAPPVRALNLDDDWNCGDVVQSRIFIVIGSGGNSERDDWNKGGSFCFSFSSSSSIGSGDRVNGYHRGNGYHRNRLRGVTGKQIVWRAGVVSINACTGHNRSDG